MTIAELHGKLAPDRPGGAHELMEDLLTSDVFGTMKYAGWEHGFADWLLSAQVPPIEPGPPPISTYLAHSTIRHIAYSFWPRLKNNREPDVALLFCFDSETPLLILVEAKYLSGTSDWQQDEELDPCEPTGNQIADQVRGLKQMTAQNLAKWFKSPVAIQRLNMSSEVRKIHLFVTAHTVLPMQDYENSTTSLDNVWPVHSYWLSWTFLAKCLNSHLAHSDPCVAALLGDLYRLLRRKDLVPFHGFNMTPWANHSSQPTFWNEHWWFSYSLNLDKYSPFWSDSR